MLNPFQKEKDIFILKRYTPLLLLPDLLHYSVLQVYTLHVFSLAHYWHITWQLTIVLIKKKELWIYFQSDLWFVP